MCVLRTEIGEWLAVRRADDAFARFAGHLAVLERVLGGMLDAVAAEIVAIDTDATASGLVYERCRAADHRISLVRRTHEWYAAKYDQRLGSAATVLRAADEVVRSCWSEAFAALGRQPPAGPLVYLDPRFDAFATPRVSVPPDLRAPGDAVVGEFVRELPIPVVALPALCADEPWWLVLAAHETGHHVQHDLGLVAETRTVLGVAVGDERAACWSAWAMEAFADAFAVLTVGPAAAWAVEELHHGDPARMVTTPSAASRYPPPPVRTALMGELARAAGWVNTGPAAADVLEWLAELSTADEAPLPCEEVSEHVRLTPQTASALVELPIEGVPMRVVCGGEDDTLAADDGVHAWAAALQTPRPLVSGRSRREAARYGVAGGVAAYRALAARSGSGHLDDLRTTLPALLATCGPTGHLAAAPVSDLDDLTRRLTAQLFAAAPDGPGGG
ncbi:hypothetical protein [Pseudonocardia sp.]|uniref:hypothetical protein n=1 Tax=Pseudonocardia sp. TaxID=60912 RepID=UPI003D123F20